MIGDQADFVGRLRAVLPESWFPDTGPGQATQSPILDAALNGMAWPFVQLWTMLQYAIQQSRILTATDVWLDLVSRDYFDRRLPRAAGEADNHFRARMLARLFRPTATRAAMTAGITLLAGKPPTIIESWNNNDVGSYAGAGGTFGGNIGYGVAGYYGSLAPGLVFMLLHRPDGSGGVAAGSMPDAALDAEVAGLKPEGVAVWANIGT